MTDALRTKQLGVARGMGIGLGVTIAVILIWGMRAASTSLDARFTTVAAALAVMGAWLAIGVGNIARLRFFSAEAIDAGGTDGDPAVRNARAILQNTLEQAVLAAITYGSLAITQERSRALIVTLAALFSAGRLLFWAGYAHGAAARALGFALTFYPSVAGLLVALATLIIA